MAPEVGVANTRILVTTVEVAPKEIIGCETRIGPELEVLVTERCSQYGVEIKDDSLARDGSQSWVVICRGVERLVRELCLSIALNQCGRTISH